MIQKAVLPLAIITFLSGCGGGDGGDGNLSTSSSDSDGIYTRYIGNMEKHLVEYVGLTVDNRMLSVDAYSYSYKTCATANTDPIPTIAQIKEVLPFEMGNGICTESDMDTDGAQCVFPGESGSTLLYENDTGEKDYYTEVFHNGAHADFDLEVTGTGVVWAVTAFDKVRPGADCNSEFGAQDTSDLTGHFNAGVFRLENLKPVLKHGVDLNCSGGTCSAEGITFEVGGVVDGDYGYLMTADINGAAYKALGVLSPSGQSVALFACSDGLANPVEDCTLILGTKAP